MDNDTSGGDVAEIMWRWRWGERPGLVIVMAAVCCYDGESTFPNLSRLVFVFLFPPWRRGALGGKRHPWRLINTTLHLRNGLNEPAVLYLPEPCVGGCEFAPVIDKLCPDLPSLEWSADVILQFPDPQCCLGLPLSRPSPSSAIVFLTHPLPLARCELLL